jgi:hypothetical protein
MKCENCYHRKVCIDSGNYWNAQNCRQYKNESLIIELPCRVGDKVYINGEAVKISFIHIDEDVSYCIQLDCGERDCSVCPFYEDEVSWEGEHDCRTYGYLEFTANDIGKTVFLSREEAERALEESEKNADT